LAGAVLGTEHRWVAVFSRRARLVSVLALAIATGLAAAACGGDDDGGGPDPGDGNPASSATTTTQPSAVDDPDAAFDAVERLVVESTDLAADMYEDPQAALDDPDNDDLERYRAMFAEGIDSPEQTEQTLRDLANAGRHMQPSASGVFSLASAYAFRAVDADTVSFRACVLLDQETVDADGNIVVREATAVVGDGEARREGGLWRFAGVVPDPSGVVTLEPGQANSSYCDFVASTNQGETP
jgi:hypothetical protein